MTWLQKLLPPRIQRTPGELSPYEDRGYVRASVRGPEGVTIDWTTRNVQQLEPILAAVPEVESTFLIAGVLVARIARRLSRSTMVGAIAGILLICDGVSFVTARTALLDGYLTVFVVAAFGALLVDRDQVRERLHIALFGHTPGT